MAIAAAFVFEVRTTGSDTACSGGFKTGASGTDRSQQDAAQTTFNGSTVTGTSTGTTTLTLSGYTATAADVGNLLQITSGTGFTAGFYEITAQGGTTWTLDRAPSAGAASAMVGAMGGALASPGLAASAMVAGNTMYVKSGTYSITSATANISGGCVTLPAGVAATATRMSGYGSARNDFGTMPLLQAGTIATFTLVLGSATSVHVENISLDGVVKTSSRGFSTIGRTYKCKAANCTNSGFVSVGQAIQCEATGCTSVAVFSATNAYGCTAHDNTFSGFSNCVVVVDCIASNNTGATTDGFIISSGNSTAINCTSFTNGRDGFRVGGATGHNEFINCLAVNNVGVGFDDVSVVADEAALYNCAGTGNSSFSTGFNATFGNIGQVTLGAGPFTATGSNDYSLNNNSPGGSQIRAVAVPTSYGGLSTNNYLDIGAAQHQDSGAGSPNIDAINGKKT